MTEVQANLATDQDQDHHVVDVHAQDQDQDPGAVLESVHLHTGTHLGSDEGQGHGLAHGQEVLMGALAVHLLHRLELNLDHPRHRLHLVSLLNIHLL